jgi:hypothetical protein
VDVAAPALVLARIDRRAGQLPAAGGGGSARAAARQYIVGALTSRPLADGNGSYQGGHLCGSGKWKGTGQSCIFGMPGDRSSTQYTSRRH